MRTFHRVDYRRAKPAPNTKAEQRLPIGQSMALILIAVAIRAVV